MKSFDSHEGALRLAQSISGRLKSPQRKNFARGIGSSNQLTPSAGP